MKGSSEPRAGVVKRQTLESGSNPGSAKFETWFEKLMIIQTPFKYDFSLVAQRLKRLPAMQETRVQSLGREDALEKEMVTHSSILAWRIPWTEKPGRLQSTGLQRVGHD